MKKIKEIRSDALRKWAVKNEKRLAPKINVGNFPPYQKITYEELINILYNPNHVLNRVEREVND